jgi:hypothetical protein
MFELCEAKSSYVYNLDVYTGAHPINSEHNTAFSVVDTLCDKEMPKQAFSGKLKKVKKYHANGITSWPPSGKTFMMSFS